MDSFDFVCPYCRRQSLVDMEKGYKYYTGSDGEVNQEFDQNMPITARYPKDLSRLNTKAYLIGAASGSALGVALYMLFYDHLVYCPMSFPECRSRALDILFHAISLMFWLTVGGGIGMAAANRLAERWRARLTIEYHRLLQENKKRL